MNRNSWEEKPVEVTLRAGRLAARLIGLAAAFLTGLAAQGFDLLHQFDGTKGREPYSSVALGPDGWLYGATVRGGVGGGVRKKGGTLFRCRPDGAGFEVLHNFDFQIKNSEYQPYNGLAFGPDWIYGVARKGGESDCGAIYRIRYAGTGYEVLHDFGSAPDGREPTTSPTLLDGKLVGMTLYGGANDQGSIYRLDLESGEYQVIHSFAEGRGTRPFGTVTPVGGWLYGMTSDHLSESEHGNIFRIRADGTDYQVVHEFKGGSLGGIPMTP